MFFMKCIKAKSNYHSRSLIGFPIARNRFAPIGMIETKWKKTYVSKTRLSEMDLGLCIAYAFNLSSPTLT